MENDTPFPSAPGGSRARSAQKTLFPTLSLALIVLAVPARPGREIDPRVEAVTLANIAPSPDGRWVAMTCLAEDDGAAAVWLVDLTSALPPRVVDVSSRSRPEALAWGAEGELGIDFAKRRSGRHWVAPETGELVRVERRAAPAALEGGWARVEVRKKTSGKLIREVHWAERDEIFELPSTIDPHVQLTNLAGVVFYAIPERGTQRLFRHDMHLERTEEVHTIEAAEPFWSVSPDGTSIAVCDDARLRVVDSTDGELLAGPWPDGSLSWLEADGSRFARLTVGGHVYLLDLWSDRQVHLDRQDAGPFELHVLSDGRFLVHRERGRLDLMQADGAPLRNLVPGELVPKTASR